MPRVFVEEIGRHIQFPDDMPMKEIEEKIEKYLASQSSSEDRTEGGLERGVRTFGSQLATGARNLAAAFDPRSRSLMGPPTGKPLFGFEELTKLSEDIAPRGEAVGLGEKAGETIGNVAGLVATDAPWFAMNPAIGLGGAEALRQWGEATERELAGEDVDTKDAYKKIAAAAVEGGLLGPAAKLTSKAPTRASRILSEAAAGAGIFGTGAAIRGDSVPEGALTGLAFGGALGALQKAPRQAKQIPSKSNKELVKQFAEEELGTAGIKPPAFPMNLDLMPPKSAKWVVDQYKAGNIKHPDRMSWKDMRKKALEEGRPDVARGIVLSKGELAGQELLTMEEFVSASSEAQTILNKIQKARNDGNLPAVNQLQQEYDDVAQEAMALAGLSQGYGTEVARALSARNAMRHDLPLSEQAVLYMQKKNQLDAETFNKLMGAATPEEVRAITKTAWEPTIGDKVHEMWIMGMLSNPITFGPTGVNTVSNLAKKVFLRYPTRAVTSVVEPIRARMAGRQAEYTPKDLAEEFMVDLADSGPAIRSWLHDIVHDRPMDTGKLELSRGVAIGGQPGASSAEKLLGGVVRTPGRFLEATDKLFRTLAESQEALLIAGDKIGKKASLSERRKLAQKIVENPKEFRQELKRIKDAGDEAVFTRSLREQSEHSAIAKLANVAQNLKQNKNPLVSVPSKVFFPFTRTPANIAIDTIRHSPFGLFEAARLGSLLEKQKLASASSSSAAKVMQRDISEQISKTLIGTTMMSFVLKNALEGNVSGGGPVDYGDYQKWIEAGNQPYSFRVGDKWVSYQRIEPFASIFGIAADVAEIGEAPDDEMAGRALAAVKDNIANKTFLLGMENLARAWANPKQYGTALAKSLASTLVPAGVGAVARGIDPYARVTTGSDFGESVWNAIKLRIPGQRETLEPRYTVTGHPVKDEYAFSNTVTPLRVADATADSIVDAEINRLNQLGFKTPNIQLRKRSIPGQPKPVAATAEEFSTFNEYNRRAAEALERIMSAQSWPKLSNEQQAKIIKSIFRKYSQHSSAIVRNKMISNRRPAAQ